MTNDFECTKKVNVTISRELCDNILDVLYRMSNTKIVEVMPNVKVAVSKEPVTVLIEIARKLHITLLKERDESYTKLIKENIVPSSFGNPCLYCGKDLNDETGSGKDCVVLKQFRITVIGDSVIYAINEGDEFKRVTEEHFTDLLKSGFNVCLTVPHKLNSVLVYLRKMEKQ